MWTEIRPELYYHASLSRNLTGEQREGISERILSLARVGFREIYGVDCEFEVLIEEGTVKLRILTTIGAVLIFLSQYGSIRTGANYLYKDVKAAWTMVRDQIEESGLFERKVCVQRRVGVIGKIDQNFLDFRTGKINIYECKRRLVQLFEIINASPQRDEIINELVQYIDRKHGDSFPWQELQGGLIRDALPPRRTEVTRSNRKK